MAWTPAHRNIATTECPVERGEAEMNAEVDRLAGAAAAAEDFAPPPLAVQAYFSALEAQVQWIRAAIGIWGAWPHGEKCGRVPRSLTALAIRGTAGDGAGVHCWAWDGAGSEDHRGVRCRRCLRAKRCLGARARSSCCGVPALIREAAEATKRHQLVAAEIEAPGDMAQVAFCMRCGGYATTSARSLAAECVSRPPREQRYRAALEARKHPQSGLPLGVWRQVVSWEAPSTTTHARAAAT